MRINHGYKINRMVGALRIIFVLINTRIRQMAPPSDLGQRRVTGIVDAPLEHVVCLGGGSYWAAVHLLLGPCGPLLYLAPGL